MRPQTHLVDATPAELHAALLAAPAPEQDQLAGFEYRGTSCGLPDWADRGAKKFKKVFVSEEGGVRGWNIRMRQDGLEQPWRDASMFGKQVTYGHYRFVGPGDRDRSKRYPLAAVLDYGLGGNRRMDPLRSVADYLVDVSGDGSVLLGRMYLNLGVLAPTTPSYFVLERDVSVRRVIGAPRSR